MPGRSYPRDGRAPPPTSDATSKVMRANRGKDTQPELTLRRALRAAGLGGYRIHRRDLPGRPDVSFGRAKVAVLLNGCFWHRCPRCRLPLPKSHKAFWKDKFDRNRARDRRDRHHLERRGWRVVTVWECEVQGDAAGAVRRIAALVNGLR
jgi:DNA mismatch endonuclease (patch repair protein)